MPRRPPVVELIDDEMAAVLRAKTGAEKLRIADRMFASARMTIIASVRALHPEWSEQDVRREAARRVAGGTR